MDVKTLTGLSWHRDALLERQNEARGRDAWFRPGMKLASNTAWSPSMTRGQPPRVDLFGDTRTQFVEYPHAVSLRTEERNRHLRL